MPVFLLLAALVGAQTQPSLPFLSPLFGDHMVVQRDKRAPIWGWATPGERVVVTMAGSSVYAVAGANGRWTARLPAMKAGGPHEVTVAGSKTVVLHDVLVGDVWLCSGQSNMSMGVAMAGNADREIAAADQPNMRLFTVPQSAQTSPQSNFATPLEDVHGRWLVTTPANVKAGGWAGFSAACYFFGRELRKELNVPIGLIHASWGGTPAESWTSDEGLRALPEYAEALAQLEKVRRDPRGAQEELDRALLAWWKANDAGSAANPGWQDPTLDDSSWPTMKLPTFWENAGLPDFDGVVWFRRSFDVPASLAGKPARLNLGPVDDEDATWINGVEVGATAGWEAKRDYPIPAGLLRPGRNVIAVRVLDNEASGGIYGDKVGEMEIRVDGAAPLSLKGPWSYHVSRKFADLTTQPLRWTDNPMYPTTLYNGMIAPLAPFALKGAVWYQGESNTGRAEEYQRLLPAMIGDWRARWAEGNFPFVIQQLAGIGDPPKAPDDSDWARLREAQRLVAGRVPNTALSVAIDVGEVHDVHPKDKQSIGKRLALGALKTAYDRRVEASGPTLRSLVRRARTLRLKFSHAVGLQARGGAPVGFAVAGADKKFYWAQAVIQGDVVVLSSPDVPHPIAARYGWASNPGSNLYNAAGLPASPFRTDSW